MCYAIPGKVEKIEKKTVIVDYFGEKRKALNELPQISVGDYIYAQGGFVVSKISVSEAESILAVWKETFFQLQEVDLRISRLNLGDKNTDKNLLEILDKASQSKELSRDELLCLLELKDQSKLELLLKTANFLRQKYHKNSCCVHGIIEISNHCIRGCQYCGISYHNKELQRYRMTKDEILKSAQVAVQEYGFKSLVLQSGEDPGYSVDELADIIKEIKDKFPTLVFISFGEIGIGGLEKLYQAGARGLLMRFETSNPKIYEDVHPGQNLESRLMHLQQAYKMGYMIITGGLIGIPGQSKEDILNDIFLAKELHAEMFSFGPFIPHPHTPFAEIKPVQHPALSDRPVRASRASAQVEEAVKVLAVARIVDNTQAKILVTTALETLSREAAKSGLLAGANSLMLNVTPLAYRPFYSIYPNRAHQSENITAQIDSAVMLLRSLGRAPTDIETIL
ncbi:MAG: radical SAM protein [Candidatus Omnitrophica bacterium]|nr:radical SAM protein [Candidatus Omnitrophota bacterium]MBU1924253.1 radical SAM protein [Candidatus Omnitrophota bacterium]